MTVTFVLQVVPNLEIMMTHAVYYWCNEHHEKLRLSEEDLKCVRKIHLKSADQNNRSDYEAVGNFEGIFRATSSVNKRGHGIQDMLIKNRSFCFSTALALLWFPF